MAEQDQRAAQFAELLKQASGAHFEYETTELHGVYDQQWAEWYAQHLVNHGVNNVLNCAWTVDQWASKLRRADASHRANASDQPWLAYYVDYLQREADQAGPSN